MQKTLFIGDVHGCLEELKSLLSQLNMGPKGRIVFVGDLIGKGPYSSEVVSFAQEIGALAVRGNHEEKILRWKAAEEQGNSPPSLPPTHYQAAINFNENDWAWLKALPYYIRFPEFDVIVVHAGMVPGIAPENQDPNHMTNMRCIQADGSPTKKPDAGDPWASHWKGPSHILFGHDARRGLQEHPFATGLDTGCVYGGKLTGYLFPEKKFISVRAKKEWHPRGYRPNP